jgi:cold shock CspA family protein
MTEHIGWVAYGPAARAGAFIASLGIIITAAKVRRNKQRKLTVRTRLRVTKWLPDRGFGFARDSVTDRDVFVHVSALLNGLTALNVGDEIEADITQDKRDPSRSRAAAVSLLS